jgi:F-type H+-transporting ATPase subunit b
MAEQAHGNAIHTEGEVIAGTTVDGADPVHAAPSALGMDATMWVALAMLVVIAIAVWKKVPALVGGMLDKQIAAIREQLDQATTLRKEAEALKAEYEAKARAAEADAAAMKAHAEEEAKQIVTKAKADAAALIDRRAKAAGEKIAAAERAAIADVRTHAATLAAAAAAQLIAANHDAKADKAIIDATISGLN